MPRYELSEGTSNKFWEIELSGTSFTTRYGRIGTDGQETTKSFATAAEAKKAYDKLVAEKTKKGYALAAEGEGEGEDGGDEDDAPPEEANPELEAAILANPDDVQAYQVYADWLQSKGDPRGELIAVQAARSASAKSKELEAAEAKLFAQHAARFLGKLSAYEKTADGSDTPAYAWHLGFLRSARFAFDHYAQEDEDVDLAEAVRTLLRHPSGKFLRELTIGLNRADPDCEYQDILDAIAKVGSASLRELFVGDYEYPDQIEISWTKIGSAKGLWKALPRLERCILQGGEIGLGTVDAPALRHLELRTGGLPAAALRSLAKAKLPALETLIVWTGSEDYGGDSSFDDVAPLLEGKNLPSLRTLGIKNCAYTDEVCAAIAKAPILKQLTTLDLGMGTMSDEGRKALIAAKKALSHLSLLDVSENTLESTEGLEGLCAEVRLDDQRPDDGYDGERYVMVGE